MASFPLDAIQQATDEYSSGHTPLVFVVGLPRSGTKLLRDLLNRHSDIAIFPNESHFIPFFYRRFGARADLDDTRPFRAFFKEFSHTTFCQRLATRGIAFSQTDLRNSMNGGQFADVLRAIFSCYRKRTGAAIVGDKTPEYITQVPLISRLLPEARFVHIVRDPRDYALSIRNAWRKSALRAVQRWKSQIRKYRQDVALSSARQITVRYEDLIKDPQEVMSGVCEFLGLEFQPLMTSLDEPSEELGDARGLRTVLASNTQKWVDGLGNEELRRIESIAGELMSQIGYETSGEPGDQDLSWATRLCLQTADGVNLFRFRRRTEGSVVAALRVSWRAYRHAGSDE